MQLTGTIHSISNTVQVSDTFKKRDFILTTEQNTPYPQYIQMELTQDKTDLIDQFQVGQSVSVDFNLRGRLWQGVDGQKCFVTIQAWRVSAA